MVMEVEHFLRYRVSRKAKEVASGAYERAKKAVIF